MKKTVCICLFTIMTVLVAACRPTPQKAAIADKTSLEKKIMEPAASEQIGSVPESWREELEFQNGVQVIIDAELEIPGAVSYPVIEVKPHRFTIEEAKRYIDTLLQGFQIYEHRDVRIKSDIDTDILRVKAEIENTETLEVLSEKNRKSALKELNNELSRLEEEYRNAPEEEPERIPAVVEFSDSGKDRIIEVEADMGKAAPAVLGICATADGIGSSLSFYNSNKESSFSEMIEVRDKYPGMELSRERALEAAEGFLKELEAGDMYVARTEAYADPGRFEGDNTAVSADDPEIKKCYRFCFSRNISGIPVTRTDFYYGLSGGEENAYDKIWAAEEIDIFVDDSGVYGAFWHDGGDEGQVLNENVRTLDFEEIKDSFKEQIFYNRSWVAPGLENSKITIKKVQLGMMRIRLKESMYVYLPVWDFIGDWTYVDTNVDNIAGGIYGVSFLTINAIDGSVIDRELGY